MRRERVLHASERWFRLLLRVYPIDFREELGEAVVEAYRKRVREAGDRGGLTPVARVWVAALIDSLRNGLVERVRPAAVWRRSGNWGRDLELARRRLVRSPSFALATIATLTVGLGAFAVVYTAVDKILIEPMPYRDPDDLYVVWRDQSASGGLTRDPLAGPDIAELQKAGGVIESAAGMQLVTPTMSLAPDSEPHQVLVMLTSPHLFELLGVSPMLGRAFAADEVGPNRPSVVMLSHALWTRLGSNSSIIGSQVWMSGTPYTVIGVMGPEFTFVRHSTSGSTSGPPSQQPDAFLSFAFHVADRNPNDTAFAGLIRVRRGTSPDQAAAAVGAVGRALGERNPQARGVTLYPVGLHADLVASVRPVLLALGAAGAFLVLVLTVNLASLLLARAAEREREFAVSRALGAKGSAIIRAMFIEGAVLGLVSGITGALLGTWGARTLVALAPLDLPRRGAIALDGNIAVVVIAVGTLLGLVSAALPATWASRVSLGSLVAASAVRGAGGSIRLRRGMFVTQVALALVLLSAGGLVVRSFERLLAANPGFRPQGVLTLFVAMGPRLFPVAADAAAFHDRLETELQSMPGVTDASATAVLPLAGFAQRATVTFPGAPGNTGDPERDAVLVDVVLARARYTNVMGMRLLAGRSLEAARRVEVPEALIDRYLAAQFFPEGNAVGATFPFNRRSVTIVGVVEQARLYDLHQDGRPQIVIRAEDWNAFTPFFTIRTEGDPRALIPDVRRVVRKVDPRLPVSQERTMDDIVTDALRQPRISALLIAGFALGALLLVAMGLFGLVSGSVTRRRGEMAVRIALGARHQQVLRLVVGESALLVAVGIVLAIPGIYAAGRLVRGLLIDVSPADPLTLFAVALGLIVVTMAASYLPARRVLRIDPAPLLRQE
jgi:predicted permease